MEMADLVPQRLGFEETLRPRQKRQMITNICEWLQAFAVYISIIAKKQLDRVPDLMGYQVLMLEASNGYKNDCWLAYDRRFRQQAASDPHCTWSNINTTLCMEFSLYLTSQSNSLQTLFCLFHSSKQCDLATNPVTAVSESHTYKPLRSTQRRRLTCHQWNVTRGQNCSYPNCCFEHVCYFCALDPEASDVNHKAIFCPNYLGHTRHPAAPQQPIPLFP